MHKGVLIYNKADVERNKYYIKWIKEEGKKYELDFKLVYDDICNNETIKRICKEYDFVFNRSRNYKLSKEFENLNLRVFNNSEFSKLGNDKLYAYKFIEKLDIKYAEVFSNVVEAKKYRGKIIVKPQNGHGGEGIYILDEFNEIESSSDYIYQKIIEKSIGDIRFYIINNKIVNAILRKPKKGEILSNFSKGGSVEIFKYRQEHKKIIQKILNKVEIDYGGIDFILSKDGEILFNEFEDSVGSRMLSHLGINNTMELLLSHIKSELERGEGL